MKHLKQLSTYESPVIVTVEFVTENVLCQSRTDMTSNTEGLGKDTNYTFEW